MSFRYLLEGWTILQLMSFVLTLWLPKYTEKFQKICMPVYNFIYQQTDMYKYFVRQRKIFLKGLALRKTNATITRALNKNMLMKSHFEKVKT